MKYFILFIIITMNFLNAKEIEIMMKDDMNEIKPDIIILENVTKGKIHIQYDNIIDFDLLSSFKDIEININENIYPNPCSDNAYCELNISNPGHYDIFIFDVFGKKISSTKEYFSKGINQINMNLSGLASGSYFLYLKNKNNSKTLPFIVNSRHTKSDKTNLSFNIVKSQTIENNKTYNAKIYTSGYEVNYVQLNSSDYFDGEKIFFDLEIKYPLSENNLNIELKLQLDSCTVLTEEYDTQNNIINSHTQNDINKIILRDTLHNAKIDNYFFKRNKEKIKYFIDYDHQFEGGKIYIKNVPFFTDKGDFVISNNRDNDVIDQIDYFIYQYTDIEYLENAHKLEKRYTYQKKSINTDESYYLIQIK